MVAHDAHFFLAHTAMHACKPLYRHVHRLHHTNGSNISTLGSSYGDLLDIGLSCGAPPLRYTSTAMHLRSDHCTRGGLGNTACLTL